MKIPEEELKQHLIDAATDGTLLTLKHDPNDLNTTRSRYRTVLSYDCAQNLEDFLKSEDYEFTQYNNTEFPKIHYYIKIIPSSNSGYSIPASGVPGHFPFATSGVDCLVAISGSRQGWHIYGESSHIIEDKLASGKLELME